MNEENFPDVKPAANGRQPADIGNQKSRTRERPVEEDILQMAKRYRLLRPLLLSDSYGNTHSGLDLRALSLNVRVHSPQKDQHTT